MAEYIDLTGYPVRECLKRLLKDKTTKQNIVFATDSYTDEGAEYEPECQMTVENLMNMKESDIQPRIFKALEEQAKRTRKKAEVFTPAWLCCKMNNHCDDEWFGRTDVFNHLEGVQWMTTTDPVSFPKRKRWQRYVDSRRLEITCGEAPYLVSRYDTSNGNPIPLRERIGILDRKLRIVNENTKSREDWFKWTLRAFQSVYGYEWQGDSLLIARINLLMTFVEYMQDRWQCRPSERELRQIVNVIVWNLWQMDGLKGTVPFSAKPVIADDPDLQLTLFDLIPDLIQTENPEEEQLVLEEATYCKIHDWRANKTVLYVSLRKS